MRHNRVVVGWRAMAFVTEKDGDGHPLRRPVAQSRIYSSKDAAASYVEALRVAGFDEPYIQEVERAERKEMGIT